VKEARWHRAFGFLQLGREAPLQPPAPGELIGGGIEAGGKTSKVSRPERRCLLDLRPVHRGGEEIGEALHGPVGRRHAPVDSASATLTEE
jgi:hypothetical protein